MAFHPRARTHWQRRRRHGNTMTLISSSQCTRWCIDCHADQLETFCLVELKDTEHSFIRLSHRVKEHIHLISPQRCSRHLFLFLSGEKKKIYLDCFCRSHFRKGSLDLLLKSWWQPLWLCWGVCRVQTVWPGSSLLAVSCSCLKCLG